MFNSMNYVYEVYKERSFSKAAANLYISQPSLSAAVKKVEEKIGAPIFDRSVSPIKLTECGRHYIKAVEEIMDIQNQAFQILIQIFVVIAVALTLISLVDYILKNKSVLSMQD